MKRALVVIGGLFLLAGAILGFLPQSANDVSCGSVFRASDEATVDDLVTSFDGKTGTAASACEDRRSLYRPIVWVLIGIGGAALVAAAVITEPWNPSRSG